MRRSAALAGIVAGVALLASIAIHDDPPTPGGAAGAAVAVGASGAIEAPRQPPPDPCEGERPDDPVAPASDLAAILGPRLADSRFAGAELSVSVWIEGLGEVVSHSADEALLPASVQKLFTAIGAYELLDPAHRFDTRLVAAGSRRGGTLNGDLVLLGGGDPTLTRIGPHSLAALAAQVRTAGITSVTGRLLVDASRYEAATFAPGWQDWQVPTYAGPLSALVVDDNRWRSDPGYLADPALGNAEAFRAVLAGAGVTVAGPTEHGQASGEEVGRLDSPPVLELVRSMLLGSDNEIAEALVREIGTVVAGEGTTVAGTEAITSALEDLCVPIAGMGADGSGLSRSNRRSAREWQQLLWAARGRPWWPDFVAALPVAGRSGTLAGRLTGTATAGNVRAKTGSILEGRALAGYLTTAGGRPAVFAVVANHPDPGPLTGAIDDLVAAVASYGG